MLRAQGDWLGLGPPEDDSDNAIWIFKKTDKAFSWMYTKAGSGWVCIDSESYLNVKGSGKWACFYGFGLPDFTTQAGLVVGDQ